MSFGHSVSKKALILKKSTQFRNKAENEKNAISAIKAVKNRENRENEVFENCFKAVNIAKKRNFTVFC